MLVLTRKVGEGVFCTQGESTIQIRVLEIIGNRIKLGIEAPRGITVLRDERPASHLPREA